MENKIPVICLVTEHAALGFAVQAALPQYAAHAALPPTQSAFDAQRIEPSGLPRADQNSVDSKRLFDSANPTFVLL